MNMISENLRALMGVVKINASELARKTGIAQPIIHRLLTGQNTNPKLATIQPIAQYLGVTVSQLIGEDVVPPAKLGKAPVEAVPVSIKEEEGVY